MATPISDLGKIRIFVESELLSGRTYRRLSSAPVCLEFWLLAGMMHRVEAPPDQQPPTGARHVHQTLVPALETADAIVYALVGMVFLAAALGMLAYSLVAFPANLRDSGFALGIVTLVNNLLLVMIIMEVLRTVLSYLQERGTSLQPSCLSRRFRRPGAYWLSAPR